MDVVDVMDVMDEKFTILKISCLTEGGLCTIFGTQGDDVKRLNAIFYRSESGKEPVRECLKELGEFI